LELKSGDRRDVPLISAAEKWGQSCLSPVCSGSVCSRFVAPVCSVCCQASSTHLQRTIQESHSHRKQNLLLFGFRNRACGPSLRSCKGGRTHCEPFEIFNCLHIQFTQHIRHPESPPFAQTSKGCATRRSSSGGPSRWAEGGRVVAARANSRSLDFAGSLASRMILLRSR
jgi:hypothetical protein